MRKTGMNMGQVKTQNRSAILNFINVTGPVSRKDIAEATGLTPASVTQITQAFLSEGILKELGTLESENGQKSGAGRKKVLVDIDFDARYLYSVNIEQEKVTVALCNLKGLVTGIETFPMISGQKPEAVLGKITEACGKLAEEAPRKVRDKIKAVSVGIPGIVDRENGKSIHAYGIWEEEVAVCDFLTDHLHLPCFIENNVNAFARASMLYGIGRQYDNIMVIKWGPGVGSTIIIDHEVYEGRHGKAAELGHFIVDKNGRRCNCGRIGCLETKVSYNALNEIVKFQPDDFEKAYESAESEQKAEIDKAIDLFARSIVNSATILAPNRIVLSGFLFKNDIIRQKLIECAKSYDKAFDQTRIMYTLLYEAEDYIGPVATYVQQEIF